MYRLYTIKTSIYAIIITMKKLLIIWLSFAIPIFSQVYSQQNFKLTSNVKKVSVLASKIYQEDGEYVESFPYSIQTGYKTDLNLYYLEFNLDGTLKKSRLFFPRDFYGQFSLLEPILDLESSDFGEKINYLTKLYRYKYKNDHGNVHLTFIDESDTEINILLKDEIMLEDEYYIYTHQTKDDTNTTLKKRKGSSYGYRRIEEKKNKNIIIRKEYINNRFLVAKENYYKSNTRDDYIKVTQSNILLKKNIYGDNGLLKSKSIMSLSWRNKFVKWPDINFRDDYNYDSYISDLERKFKETIYEFKYDNNNRIIQQNCFIKNDNEKNLMTKEIFIYDDLGNLTLHKVNDNYKEYIYDKFGNWTIKTLGQIKLDKGIEIQIPNKKYNRTISYFN